MTQVFRDGDKVASVGHNVTGTSFQAIFGTLYAKIDEQLMKVLELAQVIDEEGDDVTEEP